MAKFCSTLAEEKSKFLKDYTPSSVDSGMAALVKGMSSIGEIPIVFDRLDKVAPSEIEPDVAAVRDNFRQQIQATGGAGSNPLGALASGVISSLISAGPFQRVSDYIRNNCPGQGGAVTTSEPSTGEQSTGDTSGAGASGAPHDDELVYLGCASDGSGTWTAYAFSVTTKQERQVASIANASVCAIGGNVLGTLLSIDGRYVFGGNSNVLADLGTGNAVVLDESHLASIASQLATGSGLTKTTPDISGVQFDATNSNVLFTVSDGSTYEAKAEDVVAGNPTLDGPVQPTACFAGGPGGNATPVSFSHSYCDFGDGYSYRLDDPADAPDRENYNGTNCDVWFAGGAWVDDNIRVGLSDGIAIKKLSNKDACATRLFPLTGDQQPDTVVPLPGSRIVYLPRQDPSGSDTQIYSFDLDNPQVAPALFATVQETGVAFGARGASA